MQFGQLERLMAEEKPNRVLVLGDTNSALCALLAERQGIPAYHMEAGNRCFDPTVPEEINRKVIDTVATFNLPYTRMSRGNLLREGIPSNRIWVSGNPIYEVLCHYEPAIEASPVLVRLGLVQGGYILVTAHRAENVDVRERLENIVEALHRVAAKFDLPVICSVHPRTRSRLLEFGIEIRDPRVSFCIPFGFFDFIKLQKNACCVITDSGTVQEESCLFGVPAVTIRRTTERPETVVCGSNIVSGLETDRIVACVELAIRTKHDWAIPEGYEDHNVSTKIAHFVLGGMGSV
jgi:UDP-N-acetylglucosamine 2-epimerase (non-hydrolysing)